MPFLVSSSPRGSCAGIPVAEKDGNGGGGGRDTRAVGGVHVRGAAVAFIEGTEGIGTKTGRDELGTGGCGGGVRANVDGAGTGICVEVPG